MIIGRRCFSFLTFFLHFGLNTRTSARQNEVRIEMENHMVRIMDKHGTFSIVTCLFLCSKYQMGSFFVPIVYRTDNCAL